MRKRDLGPVDISFSELPKEADQRPVLQAVYFVQKDDKGLSSSAQKSRRASPTRVDVLRASRPFVKFSLPGSFE